MTKKAAGTPRRRPAQDGPILAALDFTPDSEAALVWACAYAGHLGARVLALHVVHDPADAPGTYRAGTPDLLRPMQDVAAGMMEAFLDRVRAEHAAVAAIEDLEPVLVTGLPATRILEIAASRGARMIVMGSRGRTGLPHLLLGSKAERVAQLSPIPVTIVKAKDAGAKDTGARDKDAVDRGD